MRITQRCFFEIHSEIIPAKPKFEDKPMVKVDVFQGYNHGNLEIIQVYIRGNDAKFP